MRVLFLLDPKGGIGPADRRLAAVGTVVPDVPISKDAGEKPAPLQAWLLIGEVKNKQIGKRGL